MKQLDGTGMKRLHRDWRRRSDRRVSLILEGIASPWNLGAILRTAAAYRVEHIWIAASQVTPETANVGRVALGAERQVPCTSPETADEAASAAEAAGFTVVGLELADEATAMHTTALPQHTCLAIGHEDRGLSKGLLARCSAVVYLPQVGRIGSLNVATATSIALYETRRQEWAEANDAN